MPVIHLKQHGLRHSICGPFIKDKERTPKLQKTWHSIYIYLSKPRRYSLLSIWHVLWIYLEDLLKRTRADKILRNKFFNITKNPKYDGYQRSPASIVYKFVDKNLALVVEKW